MTEGSSESPEVVTPEGPPAVEASQVGFWLKFDRLVDGRRTRLLIGAAVLQAVFAPAIDRSLVTLKDSPILGETARELSSVSFAGFAAISLLGSVTMLLLCFGMLAGRATALATSHDSRGFGAIWAEAFSFVHTEWSILSHKHLVGAWGAVAGVSYVALASFRDVARIFRFLMWEGPISWFDLKDTAFATPLVWLYKFENGLEFGTLIAAVLGLGALAVWLLQPVRPGQDAQLRSGRSASSLARAIDVTDSSATNRAALAFQGDLVGRVLRALGDWKAPSELESEADLQRCLSEYLGGLGFAVRTEAWIGRRDRADIVVEEAILLELKFGKLGENAAKRLDGQARQYAGLWTGRGPLLVVCVGASEARLQEYARSAAAWNRQLVDVSPNEEGLPAPILVLERVGQGGAGATGGES